jgi:hypothetical protein
MTPAFLFSPLGFDKLLRFAMFVLFFDPLSKAPLHFFNDKIFSIFVAANLLS